MSILLDALKKSETQRQLGKTPTIHSAVEAPGAERETEQQWITLSLLTLSAVAIAWFGWQQFREPVATLHEAGAENVAMSQAEETPLVAEKAQTNGTNRKPTASMWQAKKDLTGLTIQPLPDDVQERKEQLSQSFNSYEAENDTATETDPAAKTGAKTSLDTASAQQVAEEAPDEEPTRGSFRPEPHEAEPISFWQIPQALRDGLPEFRINVLVYAQEPKDRFLFINGQRLVEKEELMAGVVLDEIRRDGAIFRYRNYRFLVKG
jgi:general secretion pathway protein B